MLTAPQHQLNAMRAASGGSLTRPMSPVGQGPVASPIAADQRQPFDWTFFFCGSPHPALHFEPSRRDLRQWRVFRDGQPWMCAGLERVWRAMQTKEMRPALERLHKR